MAISFFYVKFFCDLGLFYWIYYITTQDLKKNHKPCSFSIKLISFLEGIELMIIGVFDLMIYYKTTIYIITIQIYCHYDLDIIYYRELNTSDSSCEID